jgi:hypothetical protein
MCRIKKAWSRRGKIVTTMSPDVNREFLQEDVDTLIGHLLVFMNIGWKIEMTL